MNCLVLLSVSERLGCEGRNPSEFPWAEWLASVAARAYLRLGLVQASTASIKAQATNVKKAEAP